MPSLSEVLDYISYDSDYRWKNLFNNRLVGIGLSSQILLGLDKDDSFEV